MEILSLGATGSLIKKVNSSGEGGEGGDGIAKTVEINNIYIDNSVIPTINGLYIFQTNSSDVLAGSSNNDILILAGTIWAIYKSYSDSPISVYNLFDETTYLKKDGGWGESGEGGSGDGIAKTLEIKNIYKDSSTIPTVAGLYIFKTNSNNVLVGSEDNSILILFGTSWAVYKSYSEASVSVYNLFDETTYLKKDGGWYKISDEYIKKESDNLHFFDGTTTTKLQEIIDNTGSGAGHIIEIFKEINGTSIDITDKVNFQIQGYAGYDTSSNSIGTTATSSNINITGNSCTEIRLKDFTINGGLNVDGTLGKHSFWNIGLIGNFSIAGNTTNWITYKGGSISGIINIPPTFAGSITFANVDFEGALIMNSSPTGKDQFYVVDCINLDSLDRDDITYLGKNSDRTQKVRTDTNTLKIGGVDKTLGFEENSYNVTNITEMLALNFSVKPSKVFVSDEKKFYDFIGTKGDSPHVIGDFEETVWTKNMPLRKELISIGGVNKGIYSENDVYNVEDIVRYDDGGGIREYRVINQIGTYDQFGNKNNDSGAFMLALNTSKLIETNFYALQADVDDINEILSNRIINSDLVRETNKYSQYLRSDGSTFIKDLLTNLNSVDNAVWADRDTLTYS